jgi:hypothetical protein
VNGAASLARAPRSLHARLLGDAFDALPAAVRDLHDGAARSAFRGLAKVERGANSLAVFVAWLVGFPAAGAAVPVAVTIEASGEREIWRRDFAGRRLQSELTPGLGPDHGLLIERFGPARIGLALLVDGGRLRIVPRRMSVFGVSLPTALAPRGESFESESDGRFSFHVEIILPWVGLLVSYEGQLVRA